AMQRDPLDEGERPEQNSSRVGQIHLRREGSSKEYQESVLGAGLTIEGKIAGVGNVRIAGQFKGDVHVEGDLMIDKGSHMTGKIHAETVVIGGELEGDIVSSAQVKLLESAQMIGNLKASTLTVAAGSRMRGNVEFGWDHSEPGKLPIGRANEKAGNGSSV
ncbi:MAG: bactofilin family protein, partial [bacterium]